MMKWRSKYQCRHALSSVAAILLALTAGFFISPENIFWAAAGALLAVQTSRGTPARQSLYLGFTAVLAIIAGFIFSHYIVQLELYIFSMMATLLVCSMMLMLRQPANLQVSLLWVVPPLMILVSALWPAADEMALASRLVLLTTGGVIGLMCGLIVLPVQQYHEFRFGITPILTALIKYSAAFENTLLTQAHIGAAIVPIMQTRRHQYPEWVFEPGFNRNFRSSFRFVLVQIEKITEAFFSLDYHIKQDVEPEMMARLAPHLALMMQRNRTLLTIIHDFFAGKVIESGEENFTDDITALHNALDGVLPASHELLDLSVSYTNISALARDVIDVRELLLQVTAGLPMNDFAMEINTGNGI